MFSGLNVGEAVEYYDIISLFVRFLNPFYHTGYEQS